MPPRWTLLLVPVLILSGCAGTPGERPSDSVTEDFEKGIRNWDKRADVPQDPNNPGKNVSWVIESSREQSASGEYSVNFTLDGGQDNGTIWLVRPLQIPEGEAFEANVSAMAWSPSQSDNRLAHLVLYMGTEQPVQEEDFPRPGENTRENPNASRGGLREELNRAEGWEEYSFGWNIPTDHNGTLFAAVGISAVWETELTYFVDDLEVELEPIEAAE